MGWSHYWRRDTELPAVAFAQASRDCRKAIGHAGVALAGFDGTGGPIFRDDAIVFNGVDPVGFEPFEIHQVEFDRDGGKVVRSFCKTAHAPYDIAVRVALIVLKHYLGEAIRVGSDAKDEDWAVARSICQETLGYGGDFKLHSNEATQ